MLRLYLIAEQWMVDLRQHCKAHWRDLLSLGTPVEPFGFSETTLIFQLILIFGHQ
jgi:hypothetical protein